MDRDDTLDVHIFYFCLMVVTVPVVLAIGLELQPKAYCAATTADGRGLISHHLKASTGEQFKCTYHPGSMGGKKTRRA
jgi:hypothetical protein